jgi:hypothetical protein
VQLAEALGEEAVVPVEAAGCHGGGVHVSHDP